MSLTSQKNRKSYKGKFAVSRGMHLASLLGSLGIGNTKV